MFWFWHRTGKLLWRAGHYQKAHCCDPNPQEADIAGSQVQPCLHSKTVSIKTGAQIFYEGKLFLTKSFAGPEAWFTQRQNWLFPFLHFRVHCLVPSRGGFLVSLWVCGTELIWCVSAWPEGLTQAALESFWLTLLVLHSSLERDAVPVSPTHFYKFPWKLVVVNSI